MGLENKKVDFDAYKRSGLIILIDKDAPEKTGVKREDLYPTRDSHYKPKVRKEDLYRTK